MQFMDILFLKLCLSRLILVSYEAKGKVTSDILIDSRLTHLSIYSNKFLEN